MPWLHQILSFAPFMACVFSAEPAGVLDDQKPPGCHCPDLFPRLECQPTGSGRQRRKTAGLWCRAGLGSRTPVDVFLFWDGFAWGKFLCRGCIEKTLIQSDPYLQLSISLSHTHTHTWQEGDISDLSSWWGGIAACSLGMAISHGQNVSG